MSFVATAVIGGAVAFNEVRKNRKMAKALASIASRDAQAQTEAIEAQTKAMRQSAVAPPPPPPAAPVSAPIRQAAPGTGSQVLSPAMLIRRAGKRTTRQTNQGQSLGYGSRL
jgi:hypothetical protein